MLHAMKLRRPRGMAVPLALVVTLFLSTLIVASLWMSKTQYAHTNLATERIVAGYLAEAGHNAATAKIMQLGRTWYEGHEHEFIQDFSDAPEGPNQSPYPKGSAVHVYLKEVGGADGTLDRIEIYSKGIHGQNAELFYQEVALIPAPDFAVETPSEEIAVKTPSEEIKDVKVINRFKITSKDVDEDIEDADLDDEEVQQQIRKSVIDRIEIVIRENTKKQNRDENSAGITSFSGEGEEPTDEEKTEYLANKGREAVMRDRMRLVIGKVPEDNPGDLSKAEVVNTGGSTGANEEALAQHTADVLFGRVDSVNGLFRQNTVGGGDPRTLARDASRVRLHYSLLWQKLQADEDEGELEVEQRATKVEKIVPLFALYRNHRYEVIVQPLEEYLSCLVKSIDVREDPDTDKPGSAEKIENDTIAHKTADFAIAGDDSFPPVASHQNYNGYILGAKPPLSGNIANNSAGWSKWTSEEGRNVSKKTIEGASTSSVSLGDNDEPSPLVETDVVDAIADGTNTQELAELRNKDLISEQELNEATAVADNSLNTPGNTTSTTSPADAESSAAPAEEESGLWDTIKHVGSEAVGHVAAVTVTVVMPSVGLPNYGAIQDTVAGGTEAGLDYLGDKFTGDNDQQQAQNPEGSGE